MKINSMKIELLLAERQLTRKDYAALCGISRQSLSTILRRGTCELPTAGKLAAGLGLRVEEIVRREECW